MTLTLSSAARSAQLLGLLAAAIGAGATLIAPFCASTIWLGAGLAGAGLDAAALASRSRTAALGLSLLKLPIVVGPIILFVSCAAVVLPVPPISTDLGPSLIMLSSVPSVVGATLRLFAR